MLADARPQHIAGTKFTVMRAGIASPRSESSPITCGPEHLRAAVLRYQLPSREGANGRVSRYDSFLDAAVRRGVLLTCRVFPDRGKAPARHRRLSFPVPAGPLNALPGAARGGVIFGRVRRAWPESRAGCFRRFASAAASSAVSNMSCSNPFTRSMTFILSASVGCAMYGWNP